jgi:hypothetical protein
MQDRCMVCAKRQKSVWMHLIVLVRDVGQVEARFNLFGDSVNLFLQIEIVLILKKDRCMVCTDCPIGSKIILGIPDGTPR